MIKRAVYVMLIFYLVLDTTQSLPVSACSSINRIEPTWSINAVNATWNINAVKAPQFWNKTNYHGEGVVIAIIDHGVNYTLPDLNGNYLGGWDFVDNNDDPMPATEGDYHGTACASIAVGEGDQTYVGVAPKAKYYALRVGTGWEFPLTYVDDAIYWALDNGTDVISISLGMYAKSADYTRWPQELLEIWGACNNASERGVIVISSSCNDERNYPVYPAGFGCAISVGASTQLGEVASFSNEGCDLVAPGDNVPALGCDGEIINFGGTSAATPHVAGAVALLLSRYGKWAGGRYKPDEIRQILRLSATRLQGYGSWAQGAGLLNCLNIINHRAYLNNAGFEGLFEPSWYHTDPFDGVDGFFENCYWWQREWPPYKECQPGVDYFDGLEGDIHLKPNLTSTSSGQDLYAGMMQTTDRFNFQAYGASRTTRELHTAFRTREIKVGTCGKARIAIKISFNTTGQTKHIYYCWYARGSDTNTTDTCYYN